MNISERIIKEVYEHEAKTNRQPDKITLTRAEYEQLRREVKALHSTTPWVPMDGPSIRYAGIPVVCGAM